MPIQIQSQNFSTEPELRYQMIDTRYRLLTHIHQFAEMLIMLEGELTVTVDGKAEMLTKGQAAFVFPFQRHGYHSDVNNKLAVFVFSPALLSDYFKSIDGLVGERAVFTPSKATLKAFEEKIFEADDFGLSSIKGCIYLALSDFSEQIDLKKTSSENNMSERVVSYINEHITEEITLASIAQALGYSPKYLSNCISKLFGMNLRTVIAAVRVNKAKYLLRETDKTGLEIMSECGFGTERSYHRQFKAILGRTPKYIRKNYYKGSKIDQGIVKKFQ